MSTQAEDQTESNGTKTQWPVPMVLWWTIVPIVLFLIAFHFPEEKLILVVWTVLAVLVISLLSHDPEDSRGVAPLRVGYSIALAATIAAPVMLNEAMVAEDAKHPNDYHGNLIGVLRGCDFAREDAVRIGDSGEEVANENARIPIGIKHCGTITPQYVLYIGGMVLNCHVNGNCHANKAESCDGNTQCHKDVEDCDEGDCRKSVEERTATLKKQTAVLATLNTDFERAVEKRKAKSLMLGASPDYTESVDKYKAAKDEEIRLRGEVAKQTAVVERAERNLDAAKGKAEIKNNVNAHLILGGIVVPIYFPIFALFGALVSMYRKLPEFQARMNPHYENDYKDRVLGGDTPQSKIHPSQVSDLVMFQILQVFTSFPVSILAFTFVKPDTDTGAYLLAFVAGFSTETILIAARKFVDQLISAGPRGALATASKEVRELEKKIPDRTRVFLNDRQFVVGDLIEIAKGRREGTSARITSIGESTITVMVEDDQFIRPDSYFRAPSQDDDLVNLVG